MRQKLSDDTIYAIRRYGHLLALVFPLLVAVSLIAGYLTGHWNGWALLPAVFMHLVLPLADRVVGADFTAPRSDGHDELRWLPMICLPVYAALLAAVAYVVVELAPYNAIGLIGIIHGLGMTGGIVAINAAHELIHRRQKFDRVVGGWLLACVSYGSFKIEHLRGHHVAVATPDDASSAAQGESVYRVVVRAMYRNLFKAWRLEVERLRRLHKPAFHPDNELLRWTAASAVIAAGLALWLGPWALVFFIAQSFVAISALEVINYIEHYGLRREQDAEGRWQRPGLGHSWNSPTLLSNLMLFQLQRHSDHHVNPGRTFDRLRHQSTAPQLPAGYAELYLRALIPPLWTRSIDCELDRYRAQQPT